MRTKRQLSACILMVSVALVWLHASAQSVSDYRVEAAYIYNFAKFVEWPAQNDAGVVTPMRFCILNDRLFEVELNSIVKGKSIAGRPVDVLQVQDLEQARTCQVLFINSAQDREAQHFMNLLQGSSVLTVGEAEDFLKQGGIIRFRLENDRVQFEINHKGAIEAGLYISSRLLAVAKRVME